MLLPVYSTVSKNTLGVKRCEQKTATTRRTDIGVWQGLCNTNTSWDEIVVPISCITGNFKIRLMCSS